MTEGELAELIQDCPTLYHVAERGSWPSIRQHGLLSTSALLDLYGVHGPGRDLIEGQRRPQGVRLEHPALGRIVVRDQKPMDDAGLRKCLLDGLSPEDWYRLLNRKVFFWLTRARLHRLLNARPYRSSEHDVLELDTAALVAAYREAITLSPINSGATRPFPAPRGLATFLPIAAYPYGYWRSRRPRGERVVELAIDRCVPDIARFVRRVTAMRSGGRWQRQTGFCHTLQVSSLPGQKRLDCECRPRHCDIVIRLGRLWHDYSQAGLPGPRCRSSRDAWHRSPSVSARPGPMHSKSASRLLAFKARTPPPFVHKLAQAHARSALKPSIPAPRMPPLPPILEPAARSLALTLPCRSTRRISMAAQAALGNTRSHSGPRPTMSRSPRHSPPASTTSVSGCRHWTRATRSASTKTTCCFIASHRAT